MIENFGTGWWHPTRFGRRRGLLEARARIMVGLRQWFDQAGFLEVETPALQVSPGMETHLQPFTTELVTPEGKRQQRYLQHERLGFQSVYWRASARYVRYVHVCL